MEAQMTRLMTTYNYMKNINKLTNSIPAKISCFIDTLRFMRLGDSSEIPNPFPIFGFRIHYSTFPSLRHLITEIFLQQHYSIPFETRAPVIFDIGSNIGIATLFYKLAYPESRIFCFEPDPDTFQILQKNINDNKVTDVTIYNYALAHHSGEALLYVPDWSDGSSSIYRQKLLVESAHIHTSSAEQSDHISEKSIKIRKCSEILDDLSLSRIHLIKIDTEGAETEIIEDIREHLDRIDNIIIEVNGPEIPILDGSSTELVNVILEAGISKQDGKRSFIRITKPITLNDGHTEVSAIPYNGRRLTYSIHFKHHSFGTQNLSLDLDEEVFIKDIAPARTFGFLKNVEMLRANGLAKGGSFENAIVIGDHGILNETGLRFDDEFVRHKILDLIGDLSLIGYPIHGHIIADRAGHSSHIRFLRKLLSSVDSWELVSQETELSQCYAPAYN